MMKSNNPFCDACMEPDCLVSFDETCAMIRVYRSTHNNPSVPIDELSSAIETHLSSVQKSGVSSQEKFAVTKSLNAILFGMMMMSKKSLAVTTHLADRKG